jgi:hypothetical protein
VASAELECPEPQYLRLAPIAASVPFHFSEGLACLPPADPLTNPVIDWGDGSTSPGTLSSSAAQPGSAEVEGEHVYTQRGSFHITVEVTDEHTGEVLMRGWHTSVLVGPGPSPPPPFPSPQPGPAPGTPGDSTARLQLQRIRAKALRRRRGSLGWLFTALPSTQLRATISWGDGGHSAAIIAGSPPRLALSGTHRWRRGGVYRVTVTVSDRHGATLARASTRVAVS